MKRLLLIIITLIGMTAAVSAQNSKQVKALQKQRDQLQKQLTASQKELERTKKDITQHRKTVQAIGIEMDNKMADIRLKETQIDSLQHSVDTIQTEVDMLARQLQEKKEKYCRALRMARAYRHVQSPTMFILSGKSLMQIARRARNTNAFASIMRNLGEEIMRKQAALLKRQNLLLEEKSMVNTLMQTVIVERQQLGLQQVEQQRQIASLNTKEKGLQTQLSKQRNQLAQLNKKIDQVIAAEIEAARKRAEAERRKREEAERRKREAARKKSGSSGSTSAKSGSSSSSRSSTPAPSNWLTPEERALNGSFEQNKGRLPVPITGVYQLGERFGTYNVPGMKNVQLDNKGTNYIGKPGAKARAVFDGEVTAVFQFYGTKGVLVRHGSYITVYCNLSSVNVTRGQKIKARDTIGSVATNEDGKCVLHFQVRKETAKLNPEAWIGR